MKWNFYKRNVTIFFLIFIGSKSELLTRSELFILTIGLALFSILLLVFLIVACILIFKLVKQYGQRNVPERLQDGHDAETGNSRTPRSRSSWFNRGNKQVTPDPEEDDYYPDYEVLDPRTSRRQETLRRPEISIRRPETSIRRPETSIRRPQPTNSVGTSGTSDRIRSNRPPYHSMQRSPPVWMP